MLPEIRAAAVKVAQEVGYLNVTRELVCRELERSQSWLQYRAAFSEIKAYLAKYAEDFDLEPGDSCGSRAKYSGAFAEQNRQNIFDAAFKMATEKGFESFSRNAVAKEAGVAAGVVNLRWGTMLELKNAIVREAIRLGNLGLARQAQAYGNPVAQEYFKELDGVGKVD